MNKEWGKENENTTPERVIFEQPDGTVTYLEGADIEKWNKTIHNLVVMGFVHGGVGQKELESLQWKHAASLTDILKTQPSTEELQEISTIDVLKTFGRITEKVSSFGDLNNIDSWKRAFPDVEFEDIDTVFSGRPIYWDQRTVEEKAVYVAYMKDPQATRLSYYASFGDVKMWHYMDDSERFWYVWFDGTFKNFGQPSYKLGGEAKDTLIFYAEQEAGPFQTIVEDVIDNKDVKISEIKVTVGDL